MARKPFTNDMYGKPKLSWKNNPAFKTLLARYKSGAYSRRLKFNLSDKRFHELTADECHYCGIKPFRYIDKNGYRYTYNGIDRIDSNEGYVEGNVVSCCTECNKMKLDMRYDVFMKQIKNIYNRLCS